MFRRSPHPFFAWFHADRSFPSCSAFAVLTMAVSRYFRSPEQRVACSCSGVNSVLVRFFVQRNFLSPLSKCANAVHVDPDVAEHVATRFTADFIVPS